MKVKNEELYSANNALGKLVDIKLPLRASLQVAKLTTKIADKLKPIEEVRKGLIKSNEIVGGEGGGIKSSKEEHKDWDYSKAIPENVEKFINEFNELMAMEEEFAFEKIKLPENIASTCDACKHNMSKSLEIEPRILMALDKFITLE